MTNRRIWIGWALASALALAQAAPAKRLTVVEGMVAKVIDGDSLVFEPAAKGPALEVRLEGIDAPEGCQPWGPQARQALSEFVLGKAITLQLKGKDNYGRTLAIARVDQLNVNERMVAEGHAWSARFRFDKGPFVEKERVAKALRRGLHATAGALMPKDFRRAHGRCGGVPASAPVAATPAAGVAVTRAAWRCDGRQYCAQMSSCAEATYFLQNCPDVKMDGNRDGVPCEKQWCR